MACVVFTRVLDEQEDMCLLAFEIHKKLLV